ncbi:Regulator of G-protein signaling 13 [Lonchura striata]|uniref:Regulator of G-protein signaling 13 n=1 Tax=Lonchura striata TaxID=40157 RepID=A0A218V4V3_9PASE|nr:Regulator of G-protein signaling 13 [Lonchura striata domestica]
MTRKLFASCIQPQAPNEVTTRSQALYFIEMPEAQQHRLHCCSRPPLITVVRTELVFPFMFQINIDSPSRKAIIRNIQEPTQSCFDEAQRIIYKHMDRIPTHDFLNHKSSKSSNTVFKLMTTIQWEIEENG